MNQTIRHENMIFGNTQHVGVLALPPNAKGCVVLGLFTDQDRQTAETLIPALHEKRLATLAVQLPIPAMDQDDSQRIQSFLAEAINWLRSRVYTRDLSIGIHCNQPGVVAMLRVAAECSDYVGALVVQDVCPIEDDSLGKVKAATLFIITQNQLAECIEAMSRNFAGETALALTPQATDAISDWFATHLILDEMPL